MGDCVHSRKNKNSMPVPRMRYMYNTCDERSGLQVYLSYGQCLDKGGLSVISTVFSMISRPLLNIIIILSVTTTVVKKNSRSHRYETGTRGAIL